MKGIIALVLIFTNLSAVAATQQASMRVSLTIVDTCSINTDKNVVVSCAQASAFKVSQSHLSQSDTQPFSKQTTNTLTVIEF